MSFYSKAALLSSLLLGAGASPVTRRQDDYYHAVMQADFADPSIMKASDGKFYAYATSNLGAGINVQMAVSDDATTWTLQDGQDGLAEVPSWGAQGSASDLLLWAPDVAEIGNGSYVMYYSAVSAADGCHCVGAATASTPLGPFTPVGDEPFACDPDAGGDIDPDQFIDEDGSRWVTWKIDGNSIQSDSTPIMLQQVDSDGLTKIGDAVQILDRDDADGPLVEAPSLVKIDGTYYLTFSSNMYNTDYYDTSFATSGVVTDSFVKAQAPDAPLLQTGDQALDSPGGADMLVTDSGNFMAWHGDCPEGRCMFISTFSATDGKITIDFSTG